jgi:adenine phosphoribosyltransferase
MEKTIREKLDEAIRDVPDFPKPGILFKDITPILKDSALCKEIVKEIGMNFDHEKPDAIIGIESRGFLFGIMIAQHFGIPFIPIRKAGKLPHKTVRLKYALEYGTAEIEMHEDALARGMKVLVHDDLLATGEAAAQLVKLQGAELIGFSFLVELKFLDGRKLLEKFTGRVHSLIEF